MNPEKSPPTPNNYHGNELYRPIGADYKVAESPSQAGLDMTHRRLGQIARRDRGGEKPAHDGMTDAIERARDAIGLRLGDSRKPKASRSEVLDVVGDRIWRGKVDAESTVPAKAQDGGWPGYSKKTVKIKGEDGAEHEVPNNFRPSGFREKWGARRMEYAYLRYKAFNNRSMRLRKANGINTEPGDFEKAYGIKQRHPNVKLSLLEKIRMKKVDINIALLDFRANQKMKKFDKIKTGKWWAI